MLFLDREEELELVRRSIRGRGRVLIKGLRGVGKTALLREVAHRKSGVYIDCSLILRPKHLAAIFGKKWEDPYETLKGVFEHAEREGKPLLLDEFTDLLGRFGRLNPYRGVGGAFAVASHLRGLAEEYEVPLVVTTSNLKTLHELLEKYSRPLARFFNLIVNLSPLDLETAARLAKILAERMGVDIDEEAAFLIAEVSGGVPGYIKPLVSVLPSKAGPEEVVEALEREFREGFFATLFDALLRELGSSEVEVLFLLSRGVDTFSELKKRCMGINLVQTLKNLKVRGLIDKVRLGRKTRYRITDTTFSAWLASKEFPGLGAQSIEEVKETVLSFEALVRELFARINYWVVVTDCETRELRIPPVLSVDGCSTIPRELSCLVETAEGLMLLETHFGGECPPEKVDRLERSAVVVKKVIGKPIYAAILISYFGFRNDTLERVRDSPLDIYLMSKRELRRLCRAVGYRVI